MSSFSTLLYEAPRPGIARIELNRPELRNAQNDVLLYELNAAFDLALNDDAVRVVILSGRGPHFSSGHDLRTPMVKKMGVDDPLIGTWGGFAEGGMHGRFAREHEIYYEATRRWRNLGKPTIAAVHGKCIAGGLMLAWACDLIVCSEDARFSDPTVAIGVCGAEWFVHPWELGPRKAKELLWTGDEWTAHEAQALGMVNRVVPAEQLEETVLAMAEKIAAKPQFAIKMTKEAVNRSLDIMGQANAIDMVRGLHQLCHAHNQLLFGMGGDPSGVHQSVARHPDPYWKTKAGT